FLLSSLHRLLPYFYGRLSLNPLRLTRPSGAFDAMTAFQGLAPLAKLFRPCRGLPAAPPHTTIDSKNKTGRHYLDMFPARLATVAHGRWGLLGCDIFSSFYFFVLTKHIIIVIINKRWLQ
ncbi:MAG TPA: hypothetical protein VGH74_15325, partial [Planctomycetaceae bacterium]